jgi:hypothetical protein
MRKNTVQNFPPNWIRVLLEVYIYLIYCLLWRMNSSLSVTSKPTLMLPVTKLRPSTQAINCAATQELPNILWSPKVHYHAHKSSPLVPILRQMDPVHTTTTYVMSILILFTHLRVGLCSGLFLSCFPTNVLYAFLFFPFVLHVLHISSSLNWWFWLYLAKSTSYEVPQYAVCLTSCDVFV